MLIGMAGYLVASTGAQSKPGYAKIDLPSWFSVKTSVALNLSPKGLKPVRWAIKHLINNSDRELDLSEQLLLTVILDLQGLQLRLYEVEDNRPVFDKAIDEAIVTLKQGDWQTLLSLREDDKRIVIMHVGGETPVSGVSVLSSTPENAFFINLVGHLSPESVAIIVENFNAGR
jgi:hypothetical protein